MAVGITLTNLVKHFGEVKAVDDINLAIEPGELFFLLGPSGCGKTTLLRCIAGFNELDAGQILIGGRDVTRVPPHERDTGMVFQSYALWPHMTVAENVAFGLEMRKLSKADINQRVSDALAMVQMSDRADYKPTQLSGGQQQRIALARALVIKPTCLLLDEPLSNLDAKLRLEMRSEIRRVCKSAGLTAVYVTHDQNEALSIADRIVVLNNGRIQQLGPPQAIYRSPANRFIAEFIGESNFLAGEIRAVNNEKILVNTAIGIICCTPRSDLSYQVNKHVTLSIRPEVIRIVTSDSSPTSINVFTSSVRDTLYLGEMAQHHIRINPSIDSSATDPIDFKLFELNPRMNARDNTQQAYVYFAPDDVVILAS